MRGGARAGLIALGLALACAAAPAAALDYDVAMKQSRAAVGRAPADYAFTATDGRRVRLADFRGKPLVVSFVYTGCGQVCPTATRFLDQAVRQAAQALGSDAFNVATIGFNLPFDNPAAMRDFARHQGVERAHWQFLSPDPGSVDRLTGEFGFAYEASTGGFDHIAQLSLVDAKGRVARQIYGDKDVGFGNASEYLVGANYYPWDTRDLRLNLQLIDVNHSPVSSTFGYYTAGQDGTTFSAAFSVLF